MIIKVRLGRWRITFSFAPVVDVIGVNSLLPNGKHILMWDFDGVELSKVIEALASIQLIYELPAVHILETKNNSNYIAYCFKQVSWRKAIEIIASTPHVDLNFFKYGVYRERFTLRVSPKCGRTPKHVLTLPSTHEPDVSTDMLKSWVRYETLPDKYQSKIRSVEIG